MRISGTTIRSIAISLGGIAFGFIIGGIVVAVQGKPVGASLSALVEGSFGSEFAIGNTLTKAAVLLLVACGYIFAAKGGLISIGAEGQLHVGGLIGAAAALSSSALPSPLPAVLGLCGGFIGGGLWGALAGWLRAKRGVNVVISTLLLNYIGLRLVEFAIDSKSLLRDGDAEPQSARITPSGRLWRLLPDSTSTLHVGVVLAVLVAVMTWFVLNRTVPGFRVRMLGLNPQMASRIGVSVQSMSVRVMFVSGGMGGVAGCSMILGEQYRVTPGYAVGFGFAGIAVALIARAHVLAAIPAAVLFGGILAGGNLLEAKVQVSNALVSVIQGSIILAAAGTALLLAKQTSVVADREEAATP